MESTQFNFFDYIVDENINRPLSKKDYFLEHAISDTDTEFEANGVKIVNCDMFNKNGLYALSNNSVDAIITDFPYGTLNKRNEWDKVIDYNQFWQIFRKIGKETTPLITTAQMPFTAFLISTNYSDFKYTLVWEKSKATGYLNAKKQPMRAHEDIVVFYKKQCRYNPQMVEGKPYNKGCAVRDTMAYGKQEKAVLVKNDTGLRYPRSVQYFVTAESEGKLHPTQKPIALFEWLIKTYTNENDFVVDPCVGSGTTAIACIKNNRRFLGFELDATYFVVAKERIKDELYNQYLLSFNQSN